jgi:hypothetical protein
VTFVLGWIFFFCYVDVFLVFCFIGRVAFTFSC